MRPARRIALVASLVALALVPASASALPGDPPIEALSPANGASVSPGPDGVDVTFTCPSYVKDRYGDPANPTVDRGDASDYEVTFSDRDDTGSDGVLSSHAFPSSSFNAVPGPGGTCTSTLPTDYVPQALKLGRVYWQPNRSCVGCMPQRPETGPVRSFAVKTTVTATLAVPQRLYGGYLGAFRVRSKAELTGDARVFLERRSGGLWRAFADEPYSKDETSLFGKLPAGRQTIRVVIRLGAARFTVATRTVTVLREGRRSTSSRDDGPYRDAKPTKTSTLQFTVTGGGRTLRSFKASVTTFCFGPMLSDNRLFVAFALLNSIRIAPDGGVVGVLRTKRGSREFLTGRLLDGHFAGVVDVSLSTCNGARKLTAVRR